MREYVEHIEPSKARADEAYAWKAERFLPFGKLEAKGENRRVLRDLTVSTVFPNGKGSRFRQIVFQPLTDAAAASDRYYSFQYQADREVVQLRGAKVYRSDGRVWLMGRCPNTSPLNKKSYPSLFINSPAMRNIRAWQSIQGFIYLP